MSQSERLEPWLLSLASLAFFFAVSYIACRAFGTYDTYRDAWYAAAIVSGHSLPVVGPGIFQTFHLGPLWFYLVAIPALLVDPLQAVVLVSAFVVAAKLPLGWYLVKRIAGPTAALLFTLLILSPGWWYLELAVLTHTSGVAASLMLLGLMLWAVLHRLDALRSLGLGLAIALAIAAHPTNILLCVVAFLAYTASAGRRGRFGLIGLAVLPPIIIMAPYFLSGGFASDLAGIGHYTESLATIAPSRSPADILRLLAQPAYGGAAFAYVVWGGLPIVLAGFIGAVPVIMVVVIGLCARGHRWETTPVRWAGFVLFCLVVQSLLLWIVRPVTPVWMAFSLSPLLAFGLSIPAGISIDSWSSSRWRKSSMYAVAVATVLPSFFLLPNLMPRDGMGRWAVYAEDAPGAMSVTSSVVGYQRFEVPPFLLRDYWNNPGFSATCDERVEMHGQLAAAVDKTLGYRWIRQCGDSDLVSLGGRQAGDNTRHRFGISARLYRSICGTSTGRVDSSLIELDDGDFQVLSMGSGLAVGVPHIYPPRSIPASAAGQTFDLSADASMWTHLMVVNLAQGYFPSPRIEVLPGSVRMQAVHEIAGSRTFRLAPASAKDAVLSLKTYFSPDYVDVVAFRCGR